MLHKLLAKFYQLVEGDKSKPIDYYREIFPELPYDTSQPIELIIHQTYYTDVLPQEIQNNIAELKRLNPDYKYKLWLDGDIEAFIRQEYGEVILQYYHRINPKYGAARADLFRYLLLYKQGGVYLDLKSTITKPLSEVLNPSDQYIIAHWDNRPGEQHEGRGIEDYQDLHEWLPRGEYIQWFLAGRSCSPQLYAVILRILYNIDTYNPYLNTIGAPATMRTTGPIAYSHALIQSGTDKQSRLVELGDFGLVYSIYEQDEATAFAHKNLYAKDKTSYEALTEPLITPKHRIMSWGVNFVFKTWVGIVAWYKRGVARKH